MRPVSDMRENYQGEGKKQERNVHCLMMSRTQPTNTSHPMDLNASLLTAPAFLPHFVVDLIEENYFHVKSTS